MTQGALTLLLGVLVVAVGLATARIQSENHARAGRLHQLEVETEWMRRGLVEIDARLATDAFRAESAVTDEWGGPIRHDAHELSRDLLDIDAEAGIDLEPELADAERRPPDA